MSSLQVLYLYSQIQLKASVHYCSLIAVLVEEALDSVVVVCSRCVYGIRRCQFCLVTISYPLYRQ